MSYFLLVIIGLITGSITSLVGASAVTLIVPALSMLFHVDAHTAIGTSLFVDIITSLVVSYSYHKKGNVELKSALWIAVAAVIGAQFGSALANNTKGATLSGLFGAFMILSGVMSLRKQHKHEQKPKQPLHFKHEWQQILVSILIGLGIGVISGIFGAGGGVMILMALIFILNYPMHVAVGTSTLVMAITATSSEIGYAIHGHVDLLYGLILTVGAVIGGAVGAKYANKINDDVLQTILNWFFILMGVMMIAQTLIK
ncbi:MAG: sulfite exporter TauE/SafE family protein [Candidatus Paralactobacillus gallistercoris]|uniref:Probable membrane transporter protein n=1 Tax=Candidatus Paralactobacillus gallistercoris TaxID=2838724 RepID=A0A948TJ79_9LACO|nr:sulfite exporter TauE/SafE family protein [Candidatus Paralactobacillus gallistercoris]